MKRTLTIREVVALYARLVSARRVSNLDSKNDALDHAIVAFESVLDAALNPDPKPKLGEPGRSKRAKK